MVRSSCTTLVQVLLVFSSPYIRWLVNCGPHMDLRCTVSTRLPKPVRCAPNSSVCAPDCERDWYYSRSRPSYCHLPCRILLRHHMSMLSSFLFRASHLYGRPSFATAGVKRQMFSSRETIRCGNSTFNLLFAGSTLYYYRLLRHAKAFTTSCISPAVAEKYLARETAMVAIFWVVPSLSPNQKAQLMKHNPHSLGQ